MPIHVYKCTECGNEDTFKTTYEPKAEEVCKCGGRMVRVFTPCNLRFKWRHGDIGSTDNWERYEE